MPKQEGFDPNQTGTQSLPKEFRRRILVLDDYRPFGHTLETWIEKWGEDCQIVSCLTSEEALEAMKNQTFDLFIVDGDLGDGKFDEDSLSGKFITEHLAGRHRFVRYSSGSDRIPSSLHGEANIHPEGSTDNLQWWLLNQFFGKQG